MLRYLSGGVRKLAAKPIGQHARLNWEFYAVVEGRCGVLLENGEKLPLQERWLWVFPPHHVHGWHGERRHCQVVVFHCGSVPRQLVEAIPAEGYLERGMTETECRQVEALGRALEPDFNARNSLSELRFDRAIIDLALLALSGTPTTRMHATMDKRMTEKVEGAIAWFRRHVREQPKMEDVAAAVHVSPSHLRRLFAVALKQNPRTVLARTQMEVALRLLAESDLKIESVASEAGYASARDFSRVFRALKGCPPSEWRRRLQPPYGEVVEEAVES
jgi:AraC family transcriptional regulator